MKPPHPCHFLLLIALFLAVSVNAQAQAKVIPGIEILISRHLDLLAGKRIGLITNRTGVDRQLNSDIDLLRKTPGVKLVALFGPEHGVRGDVEAGEKIASSIDPTSGLPVFSLYGATKEPTEDMLTGIDLLLFDIQDVGARFYTYPYTMLAVMHSAEKHAIPMIILDRPNPLGGEIIEGPVLELPYASFIGRFEMPVRHGMTMGELAMMFKHGYGMTLNLKVIPMTGWRRGDMAWATGLPWVPPSPNMPTPETALVYPGTALFEGTNISEGRGTTKPFEQIGAPFIDAPTLAARMNALNLPGVRFRPSWFTPVFSKYKDQKCAGVMLHVTDRKSFRPFITGVALVKTVRDIYPAEFQFLQGTPSFFDQLAGVGWLREDILAGKDMASMEQRWSAGHKTFRNRRKPYLLY